jgi:hypothetical protein
MPNSLQSEKSSLKQFVRLWSKLKLKKGIENANIKARNHRALARARLVTTIAQEFTKLVGEDGDDIENNTDIANNEKVDVDDINSDTDNSSNHSTMACGLSSILNISSNSQIKEFFHQ